MAVIKCSNCKNDILDSEIVCPYCDCPVSITIEKMKKAAQEAAPDATDSSSTMKIASRKDFEKEKAALMQKLAGEESALGISTEVPESETVRISRDELNLTKDGETGKIQQRNVKSKASKIVINTPGEEGAARRPHTRTKGGGAKPKEKGKKLILAITFIGVLLIAYLIYALFANIQSSMPSLKTKENKKAVVSSDSEVIDNGYKFSSSSTLVITSNDVMDDYESAAAAPWAEKADQIKHITVEDSVDRIGDYAFAHFTALKDVVLGKNVAEIGKEAFYGCESLETVTFRSDSKLRTVKDNAFTNCSELESFDLGKSIKSIGEGAFKSCNSLEEIEIPANVKIGDDAFLGCGSDFTIICKKNSSAHEYADKYGHKVEFTDKDSEDDIDDTDDDDEVTSKSTSDDDDDSEKSSGKSTKEESKKEEKKEEKKTEASEETKNDNTGSTSEKTNSGATSGNTNQTTKTEKSHNDLMNEFKDTTSKLKDPSLTEEQKADLTEKRSEILKDLNSMPAE